MVVSKRRITVLLLNDFFLNATEIARKTPSADCQESARFVSIAASLLSNLTKAKLKKVIFVLYLSQLAEKREKSVDLHYYTITIKHLYLYIDSRTSDFFSPIVINSVESIGQSLKVEKKGKYYQMTPLSMYRILIAVNRRNFCIIQDI